MRVRVTQHHAQFGPRFRLADFTGLAEAFLQHEPETLQIEQASQQLAQAGFPAQEVPDFVRRVCTWGGHPGIGARVLGNNAVQAIAVAFANAVRETDNGEIAAALRAVNALHSLGTPSFASKHLRFFRPNRCPVFDSLLQQELTYPYTPDGYEEFSSDCAAIARALQQHHVHNPAGRQGRWFVADVEMSVYARFRGWA